MSTDDKLDAIWKEVSLIRTEQAKANVEIARLIVREEQNIVVVKDLSIRMQIQEAFKNKTMGVVAIIGILIGGFATWLISIINSLLKHS